MKSISFPILFVILLLATIPSIGSETNIVANNSKSTIQSEKINGIDYVPLKLLAKLIFPKSAYIESASSIKYQGNEIKCALGSFYVLFRNNSDVRVAQMTLPAIALKSELVVPFETFIEALKNLDLIKYDHTESGFFLEIINHSQKADQEISSTENDENNPVDGKTKKSHIQKSNVKIDVTRQKIVKTKHYEPKKDLEDKAIVENPIKESKENSEPDRVPTKEIKSISSAKSKIEVAPQTIIDYNLPEDYNNKIPANKYSIPSTLDRSSILKKNN